MPCATDAHGAALAQCIAILRCGTDERSMLHTVPARRASSRPSTAQTREHGPTYYVVPADDGPYYVVMRAGESDARLATQHYARAVDVAAAWERGQFPPALPRAHTRA